MEGPKILKVGHVTPLKPALTKFCIFVLVSLVLDMRVKFEVYSFKFNRSRNMKEVPKF